MVLSLFRDLVKTDGPGQTHTIRVAFQTAKDENGEKDPTGTEDDKRAALILYEAPDMQAFRLLRATESFGCSDAYKEFVQAKRYLTDPGVFYGSDPVVSISYCMT